MLEPLPHKIIKTRKRKRTILFRIENNILNVYAPYGTTEDYINKLLLKNRHKFIRQIEESKIGENEILLFGKTFEIKTFYSKLLIKPHFEVKNKQFHRYIPENFDINKLNQFLEQWQKETIKKILFYKVKTFIRRYKFNFDINKNSITVKKQKTKWGSCSYQNNLNFNFKIIEKHNCLIDYLVLHELTHTLEKNHSQKFWDTLKTFCPKCLEYKKKLR